MDKIMSVYTGELHTLFHVRLFNKETKRGWSDPGSMVEEVGNKGEIQALIALDHVFGSDKVSAPDLVGLVQHLLCTLVKITFLQKSG